MSTLYLIFFPSDTGASYATAKLPDPKGGDYSIMMVEAEDDDSDPTFRYMKHETDATKYGGKRSVRTLSEYMAAFTRGACTEIDADTQYFVVWNLIPGSDTKILVAEVQAKVSELIDDPTAIPVLTECLTAVDNDSPYKLNSIPAGSTVLTGVRNMNQPEPAAAVTMDASNKNEIMALLEDILPAIKYEGFNSKAIREAFIAKGPTDVINVRHILLAFAAYSHIGNNAKNLSIRRVDLEKSKKLAAALDGIGIKKIDRTKTGLTLPRLAIAFMPEYVTFRRFLAGELQDQTESTLDVKFKDIAFHGCPEIRNMTGYAEFHKEFSSFIYEKMKDVDPTDAGFLKNYKKWSKVSINGYKGDADVRSRMTEALSSADISKRAAFDRILAGMAFYRSRIV